MKLFCTILLSALSAVLDDPPELLQVGVAPLDFPGRMARRVGLVAQPPVVDVLQRLDPGAELTGNVRDERTNVPQFRAPLLVAGNSFHEYQVRPYLAG